MNKSNIPKDRGWAWCVVAGSFGMHVTVTALAKCFSVLLVDFQEKFSCSIWALTTVQGMSLALWLGLAPFSNALAIRFTTRKVVFTGAVIGSAGFIASSFAPSIEWLFVTQGIIVGIGYGLAFSPSVVIVVHYFEKRRGLAMGISQSGAGIGSIIIPMVIRFMVNHLTLSGSILICGAIMANMCVFAMLMRPLNFYKRSSLELIVDPQETSLVPECRECENVNKYNSRDFSQQPMKPMGQSKEDEQESVDMSESIESQLIGKTNQSFDVDKTAPQHLLETQRHRAKYTKYLDWTIFKNPLFLIYFAAAFGSEITWQLAYIMLPSLAIDRGFSKDSATLLPSLIGVADFVTRIIIGSISDFDFFSRRYIFSASVLLTGMTSVLVPFTYNYVTLSVTAVCFGIFGAINVPLMILVMAEILGVEGVSSAYGVINLAQAVGVIVTAQIVGRLYDFTGNWHASFWLSAALSLVVGLISVTEPLINRRETVRMSSDIKFVQGRSQNC